MAESMPPTLAQMQQLNRSLTEKVLDKAARDPQWKQLLLDDSEAAMREAGFPETQQLEQMRVGAGEGEVRGQALPGGGADVGGAGVEGAWVPPNCPWRCGWWTSYWYLSW